MCVCVCVCVRACARARGHACVYIVTSRISPLGHFRLLFQYIYIYILHALAVPVYLYLCMQQALGFPVVRLRDCVYVCEGERGCVSVRVWMQRRKRRDRARYVMHY